MNGEMTTLEESFSDRIMLVNIFNPDQFFSSPWLSGVVWRSEVQHEAPLSIQTCWTTVVSVIYGQAHKVKQEVAAWN